ncbi:replication endonuclease [Herbaspirillum seropedicae]|uniref:replication endonuclease n=1 Tax=Herbaspirillum seropedicae TaxID=964 RepID=UPI0006528380|nr:replication endonuclease [Herbaspirillum seropedicae]AKN65852.1 replication protein [Herbaspirillum seropedicae]NQE29004.1 replication protein [Herbaspirillum seropedicae]UMU21830.1 replication endonuclease [Herbaspirillum seropedicae]
MPTIRQENGIRTIAGLPPRWGRKAYRELHQARGGVVVGQLPARYLKLSALLDEITAAPIPLDATDSQLCVAALHRSQECMSMSGRIHDKAALRQRMQVMCDQQGVPAPGVDDDVQFIARCCDPAWWRRQFRKVFGRTFEHAAVRLGLVSVRAGAYASDETVLRRLDQNRRNAKILDSVQMANDQGQEYALADLVAKSVANRKVRRGELMLRMRGCEEIANELGHVGVFVTLTCPSKFHAVLAQSGTANPNYNDATAREAHAYLQTIWQRIRAAYARQDVQPYGFRIAEPHHDGCPHWHMLLFIAKDDAQVFIDTMKEYALEEDGDEPGAKRNRVKIVRIEAGKGTAAGYIAKYVGKNIDDEHVPEHKARDGAVIEKDLIGDEVIRPCQRVEAWAACWGIRQFQAIGQPPVTVWRELRRVAADKVEGASEHVRQAHAAVQKTEEKPADFAAYIRAQGGIGIGRNYLIAVAKELRTVQGKYGVYEGEKPAGIFDRARPEAGIYASTRYEWRVVGKMRAVDVPWTRVNNCTPPAWAAEVKGTNPIAKFDDSGWFASDEYRDIAISEGRMLDLMDHAQQQAREHRKYGGNHARKNQ